MPQDEATGVPSSLIMRNKASLLGAKGRFTHKFECRKCPFKLDDCFYDYVSIMPNAQSTYSTSLDQRIGKRAYRSYLQSHT